MEQRQKQNRKDYGRERFWVGRHKLRIFIALVFTLSLTYACALCATYVPRVFVSFEFMLDSAKIKWRFDKNFHTTLLHSYDKNGNGALDSAELLQVKEALLAYISPRAHLTRATIGDALETLDFSIKGDEIFMQDLELNYHYEIAFSQKSALQNSQKFAFQVFDEGGFFNFIIESNAPFRLGGNEFLPRVLDEGVVVFKKGAKSALDSAPKQNAESTQIAESSAESTTLLQKAIALNNKILATIKGYIHGEQSVFSIFALIALSFCYGVFHAAAPGHAKLLTSSYFLAHNSSYKKALGFALKVGAVHIISAFLLVGTGLFVLKVVLQRFASEANIIITQISSALIILVAVLLLIQKMRKHSNTCKCKSCQIAESSANQSAPNAKNTRFDFAQWGVALAAGIIPCPTMIIVLLLCFEVGFFSALVSAISIALGMSAVVFIAAILAYKIKLSATSQKISRALEFLALFAMLILGIFMFANAESSVF